MPVKSLLKLQQHGAIMSTIIHTSVFLIACTRNGVCLLGQYRMLN